MAKITGQTGLVLASTSGNLGVDGNVWIDTTAFTIGLAEFGDLSSDGVSLQALYSFIMTQWKDAGFEAYKFPIESLTDAQFEVRNGWDWADDTTRYLIRDGGWNLLDPTNSTIYEVWMNIQTLGSFDSPTDQAYYIHTADGTPTDFQLPGEVNQAVQIYGDASHGDFDYRSSGASNFIVYLRIQGKTYASYNLNVEQAKASLKNIAYSLPLSNGVDLDIEATDNDIETLAPYTGMSITWGATQQTIEGTNDFSITIDANNGTLQQVYEFVQWSLRQSSDIDDGAGEAIGLISDEMLQFVGPTLKTKLTSDGGVYITNFNVADTNDLVFVDDLGEERTYPYVAAGTINFNDNLQADGANASFWMYFADAGGNLYNTANAIIVDDNSGVDIAGAINGQAQISFDFDYDGNVQGGRTAGTDASVILVAIGTNNAQYVSASGTITRSTLNSFTLTAAKERNYVA